MVGLSEFTPQALLQLIQMWPTPAAAELQVLIYDLLFSYCSRFFNHASKWTKTAKQDPIYTLMNWHMLWEGFHCDEPWHDSIDRPISYFMNITYELRLSEMRAQFLG